jgi:hypothetical protein
LSLLQRGFAFLKVAVTGTDKTSKQRVAIDDEVRHSPIVVVLG